jgi:2,3-bisphosphoglycerate-dependent phosphoglycerate mutase
VIGSHGTFISLALAGFGTTTEWRFACGMPTPAVYRLKFRELADV